MKLVGADSGRVEREAFVEDWLLSPSERVTLDVLFEQEGEAVLEHRTPDRTYELARISVTGERRGDAAESFEQLRVDPELADLRGRLEQDRVRAPDKVIALRSAMRMSHTTEEAAGDVHEHGGGHEHEAAGGSGIEWEDEMPEMNRQTTNENMIWQVVDAATGAANEEISWSFRVGDRVKIRIANELDQDHPMPHPFHIHGAGRFLVLARDGRPDPNLAWKDTVLVGTGETVEILLEVTNPGLWMAHCHIAEHNEAGMMFSFEVAPGVEPSG